MRPSQDSFNLLCKVAFAVLRELISSRSVSSEMEPGILVESWSVMRSLICLVCMFVWAVVISRKALNAASWDASLSVMALYAVERSAVLSFSRFFKYSSWYIGKSILKCGTVLYAAILAFHFCTPLWRRPEALMTFSVQRSQ